MAIAEDTKSGVRVANPVSSDTFSYTCSGTDRFLVVHCLSNNGSNPITGVTYAGVAMTKVGSTQRSGESFTTDTYVLKNPATGANNIVITASGSVAIVSDVISYTGVSQTFTPNVASTIGGASTTISHSITVGQANSWIFAGTRTGGAAPNATGTNYVRKVSNAGNGVHIGDTNTTVTTGSKTVSVGIASSSTWGVLLMEIEEPSGTAYNQSVVEAATANDSIKRDTTKTHTENVNSTASVIKGTAKVFTENATASASASTLVIKLAELLEAVNVSDSIQRAITKTVAEAVGAADTIIKATTKAFTEAVNAVASATAQTATYTQTLLESVNVTASLSKVVGYVRSFTETVSVRDYIIAKLNGINAFWSDIYTDTADAWSDIYSATTDEWSDIYKDN